MDSKTFIESGALEAYVMGLATEQEAKLVMQMAAQYPEVKAELLAIEDAMRVYDEKNSVTPPAALKEKIFAKIENAPGSGFRVAASESKIRTLTDSANRAVPKQNQFFKYAAAVAIIILIGSVYYSYSLASQVTEMRKELADLNSAKDSIDALWIRQDSLNVALGNQLAVLKKPSMKSVELKGMDVAPDAKAMVYANTQSGEVYLELVNLPPAPDGMQYQFWGIVDGKPVDAGMIPLDGNLSGIHPMKTVTNSTAYAISLEKKGGSAQPEGKIFVMGNV